MVSALFVRRDSIYKGMDDIDCWDADRDATKWPGGSPIIAHPPCRAWGKLAQFANPRPGERQLAIWAIEQIRKNGGVLEHPEGSRLWIEMNLPRPGEFPDEYGGFSIQVDQRWFDHRARKRTLLYICGCEIDDLPLFVKNKTKPTHVVSTSRRGDGTSLPEITKREREATPQRFAKWLYEIALLCNKTAPATDTGEK